MRNLDFTVTLCAIMISLFALASPSSVADVTVIANLSQKDKWTEADVRNLYTGIMKPRKIELLDQAEEQPARLEFYEKFITENPSRIKQERSILVFSGERIPLVLPNDQAVYEYVRNHPNAIGYVSGDFWTKNPTKSSESVELFSFK